MSEICKCGHVFVEHDYRGCWCGCDVIVGDRSPQQKAYDEWRETWKYPTPSPGLHAAFMAGYRRGEWQNPPKRKWFRR